MESNPPRRLFLRLAGLGIVGSLGGCTAPTDPPTGEPFSDIHVKNDDSIQHTISVSTYDFGENLTLHPREERKFSYVVPSSESTQFDTVVISAKLNGGLENNEELPLAEDTAIYEITINSQGEIQFEIQERTA